jgi:hypothetical protein
MVSDAGLSSGDALTLEELRSHLILTRLDGGVVNSDLHSRSVQELLRHGGFNEALKEKSGFGQVTAADGSVYRMVNLPVTGESLLKSSLCT